MYSKANVYYSTVSATRCSVRMYIGKLIMVTSVETPIGPTQQLRFGLAARMARILPLRTLQRLT